MTDNKKDAYGIPPHIEQAGACTLLFLILTSWAWWKPFMLFLCDIMQELQS